MVPINVELFRKDELDFEVRSRGGTSQEDVASLRRELREFIASRVRVSPVNV